MSNNNRTYAQFNVLTITGRISHAEVVTNDGDEFLSVTLLTELVNDGEAVAVTFNTTNLLGMFNKGWLNKGRLVTVTGHLASFSEIFFDKKSGKTRRLQRPKLHLIKAQVLDGGFGPAKRDQGEIIDSEVEIDDAPDIAADSAQVKATAVTEF